MVTDHWSNDAMVSMDRRGLLSLISKVIYFCEFDKQGLFNDVSNAVEICEQTMISAKITSNFYDV